MPNTLDNRSGQEEGPVLSPAWWQVIKWTLIVLSLLFLTLMVWYIVALGFMQDAYDYIHKIGAD